MNAFYDSWVITVALIVSSVVVIVGVFRQTGDPYALAKIVRESKARRPDLPGQDVRRVWLLGRIAAPIACPLAVAGQASGYSIAGMFLFVLFAGVLLWVRWRKDVDRPPRLLMPAWFKEKPRW